MTHLIKSLITFIICQYLISSRLEVTGTSGYEEARQPSPNLIVIHTRRVQIKSNADDTVDAHPIPIASIKGRMDAVATPARKYLII